MESHINEIETWIKSEDNAEIIGRLEKLKSKFDGIIQDYPSHYGYTIIENMIRPLFDEFNRWKIREKEREEERENERIRRKNERIRREEEVRKRMKKEREEEWLRIEEERRVLWEEESRRLEEERLRRGEGPLTDTKFSKIKQIFMRGKRK